MKDVELLTKFADRFVQKYFRERFVHEGIKRPTDLLRRVCHDIEKIFDKKYLGKSASFSESDLCLFLGWSSSISIITWGVAKQKIADGGGGYLVIKSDGTAFYAETEAYSSQTYAGSS